MSNYCILARLAQACRWKQLLPCLSLLAACASPARGICEGIPLLVNHDGNSEWAVESWCFEEDYDAFAEGFHGPGRVCAVQFYLCMNYWLSTPLVHVFIWDSQDGHPGSVIAMTSVDTPASQDCYDFTVTSHGSTSRRGPDTPPDGR